MDVKKFADKGKKYRIHRRKPEHAPQRMSEGRASPGYQENAECKGEDVLSGEHEHLQGCCDRVLVENKFDYREAVVSAVTEHN